MAVYYTKCGKKFNKSTDAVTTGYILEENEYGIIDDNCKLCGFSKDVTVGYEKNIRHKHFECRAGSEPPNFTNSIVGNFSDMNSLRIYSLSLEFCEAVLDFADVHPELVADYLKDSSDCRKVISVTCSKNKKGIAAKRELVNKFFYVNLGERQ